MRRTHRPIVGVLFGAMALLVANCREENSFKPPPPPEVGVARPVARDVTSYLEATGSIAAYASVDLQARIQGFVQEIDYQDGAEVKAGKQLFVIEPAPYQAKYQQAQASMASAQAQLTQSEAEYRRQSSLGTRDFASQSAVDQARAKRDSDQANLQSQQAGLVLAGINLGYTRVNAPFDGVVTAHLVSLGDLVGVSGPTKLATVVQLDPIYVNFSFPEQDVQRIRAALAEAGLTLADFGKIEVDIGLTTETTFPHHGVLDYVAPALDTGTGTLALRAVVENKSEVLLPGYFARIHVPNRRKSGPGLLVPDAAIGTSQAGRYVLVVDKDNVVQSRSVQTGQIEGTLRVIEGGLKPDDQVVITGLSRAVPGEKVTAKLVPMPES
jgi:multidrug efflux system membrane fusion protein